MPSAFRVTYCDCGLDTHSSKLALACEFCQCQCDSCGGGCLNNTNRSAYSETYHARTGGGMGGGSSGASGGAGGDAGDDYYDFQVGDWRDTIVVPMGRRVVVRWRADDFTGKSLGHCHVFAHSDQGMVMVFEIVGPYLLR